jgi:putative SOS response-associated peptidase YedK
MCGRYSIVSNFEPVRRLFGVNPNVPNWWRPRYNVAPTQEAPFRPNGQPRPGRPY